MRLLSRDPPLNQPVAYRQRQRVVPIPVGCSVPVLGERVVKLLPKVIVQALCRHAHTVIFRSLCSRKRIRVHSFLLVSLLSNNVAVLMADLTQVHKTSASSANLREQRRALQLAESLNQSGVFPQ